LRHRVVVRDDASRELLEARNFYESRRTGYGEAFADAIDRAFALIRDQPFAGKTHGKTRRLVLAEWPYTVVYMLRGDAAIVIAIAHHSRRPGYWRRRVR
jgi:plasmid stabilization system protein ParE